MNIPMELTTGSSNFSQINSPKGNSFSGQSAQANNSRGQEQQTNKNYDSFTALGSSIGIGTIEAINLSIGNLQTRITALGMKLSQVLPEKRTQIEQQIVQMRIQLLRLQQKLLEAQKAQLNSEPFKPKRLKL